MKSQLIENLLVLPPRATPSSSTSNNAPCKASLQYMHRRPTKKINISNPPENIILSASDDFNEVFAHTEDSALIGSFNFAETEDGALCLHWMDLDKIEGYTRRGIGRSILEWVKEETEMPIIVSKDTGQRYDDGSHLTGIGLTFANKMMRLGILVDHRERYEPYYDVSS